MASLHQTSKAVQHNFRNGQYVNAANAVVSTAFPEATQAALTVLGKGGNAIDAAVAAAWALSVCEPSGSGLGGQTSLMIRRSSGEINYLDGHSFAPAAVSLKTVTPKQQEKGFRACTVPSTVAVLEKARSSYGRLPFDTVIEPAVRLATDGFNVTPLQLRQANWCLRVLESSGKRPRILRKARWTDKPGAKFAQPRLSKTLKRLAEHGARDFYHGKLAREIAADMRANDGLLTEEDLASMNLPVTRTPLSINYRGYEIVTTTPPGGGLQLLLALKLLERLLPSSDGFDQSDWYVAVALAVYAAFEERERFPIHPDDFLPSVREWTLSDDRSDELSCKMLLQRCLAVVGGADEEPGETTHLCVADEEGNVVSLTQSIQSLFGAKVANYRLGFLYNNYLTTCPRYPHPYQLGSKCLPQSNAVPTLVLKDGEVVMALGAAGSRRIISSVLQIISGVIDLGKSLPDAVFAPRVHALLSGKVWLEKPANTAATVNKLSKLFDNVLVRGKHSFAMGGAQAIGFDLNEHKSKYAVADPRRDGIAGGL